MRHSLIIFVYFAGTGIFLLAGSRSAQSLEDGPTVSVFGQGRFSGPLSVSEESGAEFQGKGDFFLSDGGRDGSSESAGIEFEVPFEFNRGYSGISLGLGYAARDLRFDQAPFRGAEYPGPDWLLRELLIQEEFFEASDFTIRSLSASAVFTRKNWASPRRCPC